MTDDALLFEGLKVLDVGSWIAGPVAATMLADRGAEVLKIEEPVLGDGYRGYATLGFTPTADVNYTWAMDARNKRSLSLNLKTDTGMDILKKLIGDCDVYVSNQPLALRRLLNLNYEDIKALNPRMIYASLTPFGEVGPDSDNEAFDLVAYWNRSGLLNHMRPDGHEPIQAMAGMGDHLQQLRCMRVLSLRCYNASVPVKAVWSIRHYSPTASGRPPATPRHKLLVRTFRPWQVSA